MAVVFLLSVCLAVALAAAPQDQPPADAPPVSLERIRREIEKPSGGRLKIDVQPVAKFKSSVEEHVFMLTFEEQLHEDFDMTPLQRQSQEWRSKCCGINLLTLTRSIDKALKRSEERQAREQVARELAEVEARKK